jgi:hypothetical protein
VGKKGAAHVLTGVATKSVGPDRWEVWVEGHVGMRILANADALSLIPGDVFGTAVPVPCGTAVFLCLFSSQFRWQVSC